MSGRGPQVDNFRLVVQPLLDCIAPECVLNQKEVFENRLARLQDDSIPVVAEEKWQSDFVGKKIITPLTLEVLNYNAWNDETDLQKAQDLFHFLFEPQSTSKDLSEWVSGINQHALEYIREIKDSVKEKIEATWELNHSEPKAVAAFTRIVNIQMAYNLLEKMKALNEVDRAAFLTFAKTKMPLKNLSNLESAVDIYIQSQVKFTPNELIVFRCHKVLQSAVNIKPFELSRLRSYTHGETLVDALQRVKAMHTLHGDMVLTAPQVRRGVKAGLIAASKAAFYFPSVFIGQCHRFLSHTTRVPFQLFSAFAQDLPWVGALIHKGARATNGMKDLSLYFVEGGGLLWLTLLEITRLTGSTPEQNLKDSPLGEMMCAISPWFRTALLGYSALSSAAVLAYASNLIVKALQDKPELAKNLSQIIIEENMHFFTTHILTESLIEEHGPEVLNFPIDLPEALKALLSHEEQTTIVKTIVDQRQLAFSRLQPDYAPQLMQVFCEHQIWYPMFNHQIAQQQAQAAEGVLDVNDLADDVGILDLNDLVAEMESQERRRASHH